MNEFFLASNRSITVEDVEVFQLQMHNFDEWATHAEVIKNFIKDRDYSDEILKELLKTHTAHVMIVVSKSTHKTIDELILIVEASESLFPELLEAVIKINDAYFSELEPPKKHGRKLEEKSTWFDAFQMLISVGHTHESIMAMSYGAFNGYLKSAQKLQLSQMRSQTNLMRAAQHANAKEFKKLIEELKQVDD